MKPTGQPRSNDQIARWKSEFDGLGHETPDLRTRDPRGTRGWSAKYDKRGHQIEAAYFGTDGRSISITGYTGRSAKYDRADTKSSWPTSAPTGSR